MLFSSKIKRDWKECKKCNCEKKEKKLGTRLIPIIESNEFPFYHSRLIPRLFIYFFISFLFLLSPFALPSPSIKRIYRERQIRIPTHPGLSTSLCIVNTSCITCLSNNNAIPKDASSSFPQPHYKQTLRVFPTLCSQATNLFSDTSLRLSLSSPKKPSHGSCHTLPNVLNHEFMLNSAYTTSPIIGELVSKSRLLVSIRSM